MELEIQKYLRSKGIEELQKEFSIHIKRSQKYPNLILFKYNQILSPMKERICQEARGIILDESNNWEVVCRTFDKFFNSNEGFVADVDLKSAKIFEKLDGSLIQVYHYKDEWHFATSGTPDASGEIGSEFLENRKTFDQKVREVWQLRGYSYPSTVNTCLAFELIGRDNRVVVQYESDDLILIGARDRVTGQEIDTDTFKDKYTVVKKYDLTFNSVDDISKTLTSSGLKQEGYVVCDSNFRRFKLKSLDYLRLHNLKGEVFTAKTCLELILNDTADDFISAFPEYLDEFDKMRKRLYNLKYKAIKEFEDTKNLDQKNYALIHKDKPYSGLMFSLKKGQDFEAVIKNYVSKNLLEILKEF